VHLTLAGELALTCRLSERGHIRHACGPWDDEEHHKGHFLFRPTESMIFHLGVPKSGFLLASSRDG
jgi:hypothetical protein